MITTREWAVHHTMLDGECVRCGYLDEWGDYMVQYGQEHPDTDRSVLERARWECTTIITTTRR
jgi:hypothetical protein